MYKATYKDVKTLMDNIAYNDTVNHLHRKQAPSGYDVGYYSPKSANWAYTMRIVIIEGLTYEVLVQFGSIVGARRTFIESEA